MSTLVNEAAPEDLTNRWSQSLAVAMRTFNFMKQFSMFATLALVSRGSAPLVRARFQNCYEATEQNL
jgi:hypothetical protein